MTVYIFPFIVPPLAPQGDIVAPPTPSPGGSRLGND